ncbi:MAG: alanine--glyoxylate aminotransferase family protein [Chloroflexota bacterium]|nr:alanine--glyoxylate aminotransferase family protein [Chloroflexota bacterium]
MYKKLFTPGPTHVRDSILEAQAAPILHHRSKEYAALQENVTDKLQKFLYTKQRVYLYTNSSTGMMEGSIRQASKKKILNTINGAFSKRWHTITAANGIPCDTVEVPWGQAITPKIVDEALANGEYDAITVVLNETSTGLLNPVDKIAELVHEKYPDVLILVDAVSSMAGAKIEFDKWGLDVCLAGVQKCFALPPGLTVCAVSDRARERALEIPDRGYYFSYEQMDRKYEKHQTPATPAVSLIQALNTQLDDILVVEGLENHWKRHEEMASHVQNWARKYFDLFSDENYLSPTVSNVKNTRGINVAELNDALGRRGAAISNGYGPLKEKCFRIAHMGDLTLDDAKWITAQIEDILGL